MNLWAKHLFVALFLTSLAGCRGVIYTQPYLTGAFVGTYQPDDPIENPENLPSFPITLESRLVSTEASRYTFEGTAEVNGKTYTMTGFEESPDGSVMYFAPQASPVTENFVMTLQSEEGAISICGYVNYGLPGSGMPISLYGRLIPEKLESTEACYMTEESIGSFFDLEKQ